MNWSEIARLAADALNRAENIADIDWRTRKDAPATLEQAQTWALISIAATLYRDVNSPARDHPSRPRAVVDDYGIDPPESEIERYWREKDEQRT
jgi:hypothetical protein